LVLVEEVVEVVEVVVEAEFYSNQPSKDAGQ
jgi:hypothetical protein